MAFFDAVIPGGSGDLNWRVISGLLLGFLGTALLVGASPAEILHADLRGPIALTGASAAWSLGSVYGKRHRTETSPYMGAALQMLAGGAAGAARAASVPGGGGAVRPAAPAAARAPLLACASLARPRPAPRRAAPAAPRR